MPAFGDILERHPFLNKFKTEMEEAGISRSPGQKQSSKSVSKADKYRKRGNKSYEEERFEEALEYYGRSLASAPTGSRELALAYGNRSAVLFSRRKFEYCLLDINRALMLETLPVATRQKLEIRKSKCRKLLEALDAVKSEYKNQAEQESPGKILNMGERHFLYSSKMHPDQTELVINYDLFDDPIWSTKLENTSFPNVSKKVKLEQNLVWVAVDDISPGEILMIQEYFAMKLWENASTDYCAYCAFWCEALIPCPTCQQEMYCSTNCQLKAYNSYHRTECEMLPFLKLGGMHEEMVAVRLPLRAFLVGTKQGAELNALMDDPQVYEMMNGTWEYLGENLSGEDYKSILILPWKSPEDSTNGVVYHKLDALKSIFEALWRVNFFDYGEVGPQDPVLTEKELFVAMLLSHHLLTEHSGANPLYTQISGGRNWRTETTHIGSGLGTLRNHMQHSCIPNTQVVLDKRRLLVYCCKPIKAGEQIFASYDQGDYMKSYGKCCRDIFLKEINKECSGCKACIEDWPMHYDLLRMRDEFHTTDVAIMNETAQMRQFFGVMLKQAYDEDNLRRAFEFSAKYYQHLREPSPTLYMCLKLIHTVMLTKGNYYCSESIDRFF